MPMPLRIYRIKGVVPGGEPYQLIEPVSGTLTCEPLAIEVPDGIEPREYSAGRWCLIHISSDVRVYIRHSYSGFAVSKHQVELTACTPGWPIHAKILGDVDPSAILDAPQWRRHKPEGSE